MRPIPPLDDLGTRIILRPILLLSELGNRIMIIGPTNAGKSTLADALARKLSIDPVYLDQLHHLSDTNWKPRDTADFHALHASAILEDSWVMDGNYTAIIPQRLACATAIIVLDDHFLNRYLRYFRRTLFQRHRIGGLAGGKDSVKWSMIHWIWKSRNASKYRNMAAKSGRPVVVCNSLTELKALYAAWQL